MRDFALTQAAAAGCLGVSLRTLYDNWQARRETARLADYDDYILQRLGILRSDLDRALQLPLTENARLAVEHYAFTRIRGRVRGRGPEPNHASVPAGS